MIENAPDILSRLHRLEDELNLLAGGERGALKLSAGPLVVHGVLREVVPAFCRRYPNFQLSVETSPPDRIARDVAEGRLDLGLGVLNPQTSGPDVRLRPLCEEEMVFVCGADHPTTASPHVTLRDILGHAISVPEIPSELHQQLAQQGAGVADRMNATLVTDRLDMILDVVMGGDLVTCVPKRLILPYLQDGRMRILRHDQPSPVWRVSAAYRAISEKSPVFAVLLRMIEDWFTAPDR